VVLLEATHLVDEALEDAADGGAVERGLGQRREAVQYASFSFRIVDGHLVRAFDVADGQDEADALGHQLEELAIDVVDGAPERVEFRCGHGITMLLLRGPERESVAQRVTLGHPATTWICRTLPVWSALQALPTMERVVSDVQVHPSFASRGTTDWSK
jgi:hypothetical protein